MVKYADDTYLVIPACIVQLRAAELDNLEAWAEKNKLRLNRRKSFEILFTDGCCRRQSRVTPPPHLPEVTPSDDIEDIGRHNQQLAVRRTACQ